MTVTNFMIFFTPVISIIVLVLYFNHRFREQTIAINALQDNTIEALKLLHSNLATLIEHLANQGVISVKFETDEEDQAGSDKPEAASVSVEDRDGIADA